MIELFSQIIVQKNFNLYQILFFFCNRIQVHVFVCRNGEIFRTNHQQTKQKKNPVLHFQQYEKPHSRLIVNPNLWAIYGLISIKRH